MTSKLFKTVRKIAGKESVKSTAFSEFFREASSKEKKKVFSEVARKASADQKCYIN